MYFYRNISDSADLFAYLTEWLNIKKPVILSDEGVSQTDSYAAITKLIKGEIVTLRQCSDITKIDLSVAKLNQLQPDIIFAIGGGSVIDRAKLICAAYDLNCSVKDIIVTNRNYHTSTPLITIPTTFGTGSEVNMISHMSIDHKKIGVRKQWLTPSVSVIIAEVALNAPLKLRLLCGVDAWLHAIEALSLKTETSPLQHILLSEVLTNHENWFYKYVKSPDLDSSTKIATASVLCGMGLNNGRTGLLHALAGPFESFSGLSHAESLLPFLNYTLEFILSKMNWKPLTNIRKSNIEDHLRQCILPLTLPYINDWEISVKNDDLYMMIDDCYKDHVAIKEFPALLERKHIKQLYETALRPWLTK